MAREDDIVQRYRLEGTEQVEKDFASVGKAGEQAFDRIEKAADDLQFDQLQSNLAAVGNAMRNLMGSIDQLTSNLRTIQGADGLKNVEQDAKSAEGAVDTLNKKVDETSKVTRQAAEGMDTFSTSIRAAIVSIGALVAGFVTAKFSFDSISNSLKALKSEFDLADAAKIPIDDFRELDFILQKLGLSASESHSQIKKFTDAADPTKVVSLNAAAQQLIKSAQQIGVTFTNSAAGLDAWRQRLAAAAQQAAQGQIPIEKLSALLEKFAGETSPEKLVEFTNALGNLQAGGNAAANALGLATGEAQRFGKVIQVISTSGASKEIKTLAQAFAAFKAEANAESFQRVVEFLMKITDEEKRLEEATKVLGPTMAKTVNELIKSLDGASNPIQAMRDQFDKMGLAAGDSARKITQDFHAAMVSLNFALRRGREEIAILFGPTLAKGIEKFALLIRRNQGALKELVEFIAGRAIGVLEKFFALFGDNKTEEGKKNLEEIKTTIDDLGNSVRKVFEGIILPAFEAFKQGLEFLTRAINEAFGTDLKLSDLGLAAIISWLIGGVNSLALAFVALSTKSGPFFQAAEKFAAGFGINLGKLIDDIKSFLSGAWTDLMNAIKGRDAADPAAGTFTWADQLIAFLKSTPGLILELVAAFIVLRRTAAAVAPVLNKTFGTKFSGDALLAGLAVAQFTGALDAMAKVTTIVVGTLATIAFSLTIVEKLFKGLAFAIGTARAAALGFVGVGLLIFANWEAVDKLLKSVGIDLGAIAKQIDDILAKDLGFKPLEEANTRLKELSKTGEKFFEEMKEFGLAEAIKRDLERSFPELTRLVKEFFNSESWKAFWKDGLSGLIGVWAQTFKDFFGIGGTLDQIVIAWLDNLFKIITGRNFKEMWNSIKLAWDEMWKDITDGIGKWLDGIVAKVRETIGKIRNMLPGGGDQQAPEGGVTQGVPLTGQQSGFDPNRLEQPGAGFPDESRTKIEDRRSEDLDALKTKALEALTEVESAADDMIKKVEEMGKAVVLAIEEAIKAAVLAIQSAATPVGEAIKLVGSAAFEIVQSLQNIRDLVPQAFDTAAPAAFTSALAGVSSMLSTIISQLQQAIALAQQLASTPSGGGGGGGGGGSTEEFASGGLIKGKPGRDRNLIWASRDEFMIRTAAVKKYGVGLMRAINEGRFKVPRFNAGGLIGGGLSSMNVSSSLAPIRVGDSSDKRVFVDLGVPGIGIVPVVMTSNTMRDLTDAAVRNRQMSISKTVR